MITEGVYTMGELARMIAEGSQKSEPRIGNGVAASNAKNNKKAVKDILDDTERVVAPARKGKNDRPTNQIADLNRSMLDLNYATEPSKEYKERVEALAKGYNSAEDMKKHQNEEDETRQGAKDFYDSRKKVAKQRNDDKKMVAGSGIQSQHWDKEKMGEKNVFENKSIKRLHFKNTVFLTEAQMLKKVPDAYKTDGNRFIMKDSIGNEYLLECCVDDRFGIVQMNIVNKYNKKQLNEQLDRMKQLYGYSSEEANGIRSTVERNAEDASMREMLENVRRQSANKEF